MSWKKKLRDKTNFPFPFCNEVQTRQPHVEKSGSGLANKII